MFRDPIVEEIRRYRQEYASHFNHDIDAICDDIRRKQAEGGREVVTLEPKRVKAEPKDQPAA